MTSHKTVLVTGASSGIGRATAGLLAQRGYRVFGTARAPEHTASIPEGVELLPLDVTLDDSVQACVDAVVERTGRIDVLVNSAGILPANLKSALIGASGWGLLFALSKRAVG